MNSGRTAAYRDMICFALGIAGICYQQITGDVEVVLLGTYVSLLGLPGIARAVELVRGSGSVEPDSPSSPVAPRSSAQPSQPRSGRRSDDADE